MSLVRRLFDWATFSEIEKRAEGLDLDEGEFTTGTGQRIVNVHPMTADCEEYGCVIHCPSDHHMRDFPTLWRDPSDGVTLSPVMERVCPHGVGHPDPDSLSFAHRHGDTSYGVHGCDGCCDPARYEQRKITEQLMGSQP